MVWACSLENKLTVQSLRFVRGFLPQKPEVSWSLDSHWDWLGWGGFFSPKMLFLVLFSGMIFIRLGYFITAGDLGFYYI